MTSNIGSRYLLDGVQCDSIPDGVRESVMAELRKSFRPEFLNRIDETILFKPLTLEEITSVVDLLLLVDLNKRLAGRRITVRLDTKAKKWAAQKGYGRICARPLKRFLQRNVETKLARGLINGEVADSLPPRACARSRAQPSVSSLPFEKRNRKERAVADSERHRRKSRRLLCARNRVVRKRRLGCLVVIGTPIG